MIRLYFPRQAFTIGITCGKHGLQNITGDRELAVAAEVDGQGLRICVSDNGIGMEEGQWHQIVNVLDEGASDQVAEGGIGLQNVYRRMRMCYGDGFRFEIKSAPGQGARVEIRISEP